MESGDTAVSHSMKEKQQEEEVFKVLEALCGRIRKLLETGGQVTDDRKRHCLAFMEMEGAFSVLSIKKKYGKHALVVTSEYGKEEASVTSPAQSKPEAF
ncbi:hypothetical protein ABZP36_022969 [Zizania latifolia]